MSMLSGMSCEPQSIQAVSGSMGVSPSATSPSCIAPGMMFGDGMQTTGKRHWSVQAHLRRFLSCFLRSRPVLHVEAEMPLPSWLDHANSFSRLSRRLAVAAGVSDV